MQEAGESFAKQVWRRLIRIKSALSGLFIIALAVFIAIFGYVLSPDNSPDANLQTVEIQARKPGYKQMFLRIGKNDLAGKKSRSAIFSGSEDQFQYIPIKSFSIIKDSVLVEKYVDEDTCVQIQFPIKKITNNHPETFLSENIITKKYWLGTDKFGRDILSRLIIGTRVSLWVGLISVFISLLIGVPMGAISGYYRGRIDAIVMWLINITWSIPTLLLVFAFTMATGKGAGQVFIAVGLTMWVSVARLVRGLVLSTKELGYIQAARALGFKDTRIIIKHILPNIAGPVLVLTASNFATAIIIESGLSFLGIGVQPPQPSWGLMVRENYNFIITHNPSLALIPGAAIMLLVLAFNMVGNGLRDAIDIKETK